MGTSIIGGNILRTIRSKGITQKELSTKTGIAEAVISRYIRGKNIPNERNINKIADYLGVTVDYLKGWESDGAYQKVLDVVVSNQGFLSIEQKLTVINALFGA